MKEKCKKQQKKNKQRQKWAMGTEAIVKGWELNDFVVHLSYTKRHKQYAEMLKINTEKKD